MKSLPTPRPGLGSAHAPRWPGRRAPLVVVLLLGLCFVLAIATPAAGQERYSFQAGVSLGLGGALDATPDPGLDNLAPRLSFTWLTAPRTRVGVRVGQIDFGSSEPLERVFDAELTYATLSGEYRVWDRFYDVGTYFGLGIYDLTGVSEIGEDRGDTSIGLVMGVLGDFPVTERWSVLVEISGHFADLSGTQLFLLGDVGVGFRF